MRLIDGLNKAQRVVIVIALGIALAAIGRYLVSLGAGFHGGWTGYPPSVRLRPFGTGLPRWLRLIIWLVLTGGWAAASAIVLRTPRGSDAQH